MIFQKDRSLSLKSTKSEMNLKNFCDNFRIIQKNIFTKVLETKITENFDLLRYYNHLNILARAA